MLQQAQPFTNTQLEIIKTFRHDLSEVDLKRLRQHLSEFFANIFMDEADKVWDEEGWDETKVDELLNTKLRRRKS